MTTYSVDFKYEDGDDSHYEAESEQGVRGLVTYNLGKDSSLVSITITVETPELDTYSNDELNGRQY
jgi:hypothetical protein